MAKKNKKKSGGAKPSKSGSKIPKSLRGIGASLAGMLDSDAGRGALAAALTAAADALLRHRPAAAVAGAGSTVASTVGGVAGAAVEAVSEVARQVLPASLTGKEETDRMGEREPKLARPPAERFVPAPDDAGRRKRPDKH